MKIHLRIYDRIFLGNCKTDILEIPSNKIKVEELKTIIYEKLGILPNEQRLTVKIAKNIVTLTDEFPLTFFFIKRNSTIHLERIIYITKTEQIKNKLKNSKNPKLKILSSLGFVNTKDGRGKSPGRHPKFNEARTFLTPITESVTEDLDEHLDNEEIVIDQILEIIKQNDKAQLKDCINHYEIKDINTIGIKGWNLIQYASYYGFSDIVELLINDYHADVNLPNNQGWTPLYLAVSKQNEKVVAILMGSKEIDPDILVKKGFGTPLHLACKINNWKIVSLLLHKANPK